MTSYPYWVSPSNLGTVADGFSFGANPAVLVFGETTLQPCTVSLLNGSLPAGVIWTQNNFSVVLTGQVSVTETSSYEFSFRINNGSFSSDQTFKLSVTKTTSSFEWVTDNSQPLGYVYGPETTRFSIRAASEPIGAITYSVTNLALLTKNITVTGNSGEIAVDVAWTTSTNYTALKDLVYNQGQLYVCSISGTSGLTQGPVGTGINIVDSTYEPWTASRFYSLNSVVTNDVGKIYLCIQPGTSGNTGGPTGTGNSILDGSVFWQYLDQAPTWDSIGAGTVIPITLAAQATLNTQTITRSFVINLLSVPYSPVWITPAGLLDSVPLLLNYSQQLEAFDPDGLALIWSSPNLPSWLNLSNVGLLWGTTPFVIDSTSYVFDVVVSDGINSVSRSFEIVVTEDVQELAWITQEDLGTIPDGTPCTLFVLARTVRIGALVSYGFSGGMLPPNVQVDQGTGALVGFVEYHPQDRQYYFEITASDGVDSIIKRFSFSVRSQNLGPFYTITVPVFGHQRLNMISSNNASIVDDKYLYLANNPGWGRTQYPQVIIASGIKRINAELLRNLISNYMHNFRLSLNGFSVTTIANALFAPVCVVTRDADSLQLWQPQKSFNTGQRISNSQSLRYIADVGGVTDQQAPVGTVNQQPDGSVVWNFDSVPLAEVDRSYPLPWYPYHYYTVNSTVVNDGLIFRSVTAGYSSGSLGPNSASPSIVDNEVTWTYIGTSSGNDANKFWPANVYNMRNTIKNSVGWSTSWGSLASAVPQINTVDGSIVSVSVLSPGQDYWASPQVNVVGSGQNAALSVSVGITAVSVILSEPGFSAGQQFSVDLDQNSETAAQLVVASVDGIGRIVTINVVNSGSFSHIPSTDFWLTQDQKTVKVKFSAGVVGVSVVNGGTGYDASNTVINFQGREFDPISHQPMDRYQLQMLLAYAEIGSVDAVKKSLATAENPFLGEIIPVTCVQVQVEGIQWQGYTRFDSNLETFDTDATRLVDFDPATETLEDGGNTYWDNRATTFDRNIIDVWPDLSQTYFDDYRTIFDYYATLFDAASPQYQSRYSARKLWYFGKPFDV